MELVASIEKELADQLADNADNESVASHSRSVSAHSVQSRAHSEPEPYCDWLLDDTLATRGYSSECEVWWADAADETDNIQQNDFASLWHIGTGNLNSSPGNVHDADNVDFTQDLIDFDSESSAANQNHAVCDSVEQTVVKDAW